LQVYAFAPPTEVWISPMSARFINLPEDASGNEKRTQTLLAQVSHQIGTQIQKGESGGFTDSNGATIIFPSFEFDDFSDEVYSVTTTAVGLLEANLMSMLARLQFQFGLVVNFSKLSTSDGGNYEQELMRNNIKKFLGSDIKRYIDAFSNADDQRGTYIRLPELRLDQARGAGLRLPPSTVPNPKAALALAGPATVTEIVLPQAA